jgi:predicted branched-subunit amino acid permease
LKRRIMSETLERPPDAPVARPERKPIVADNTPRPAYWSRAGLIEGACLMLPLLPGQFAFGMAFGALAAQKGFSLVEAMVMTGMVYAGMSQFVILQSWPEALTPTTVAAVMLLTATVNGRFFLMSATMRPWFGTLPAWQAYPPLTIITDGGWLLSMRYRNRGGADASVFFGGQILSYFSWTLAALPGFLLAERIANPKVYGIDLLMPAFFAALLIPSYRGAERAIPWVIAGIVAVAVDWLTPGYWFIIAGAVAGSVSAAFVVSGDDADE